MEKSIYELDLLESTWFPVTPDIPHTKSITRVPGGWIFTEYKTTGENGLDEIATSVFVPYNDEFNPNKKKSSRSFIAPSRH